MVDKIRSVDEFIAELNARPLRVKIYEKLRYRFPYWLKHEAIFNPFVFKNEAKHFIQRGRRGWSYRDSWDIFSYLDDIIPAMIKQKRDFGMGYQEIRTEEDERLQDYHTEAYIERHKDDCDKFKAILTEIIEGFEAHKHFTDCMGEGCPDDWEHCKKRAEDAGEKWDYSDHYELRAKFKRGMELFHEWYDALWD